MENQKENPLVSVIIPVYNMEKYLEETLESVLASTYPNIEIILVDDESKDNSFAICRKYAEKYPNVFCFHQTNGGASSARNTAISQAKGEYILPVDADNLISPEFISLAVEAIKEKPEVKVVCPMGVFIGDRKGEWKQPPYSVRLLARKNMIDACALYRRKDWERTGGYCVELKGREDWEFWISVLKDGGDVIRLPHVGLFYRVRSGSKRIATRSRKKILIDVLNKRHPEFFQRELKGPLRYKRTYSRLINTWFNCIHPQKIIVHPDYKGLESFMYQIPELFAKEEGECIYKGRNELRLFHEKGYELVVKSYKRPHIINRIAYGFLRSSKAERAYRYGLKLLDNGFGTPQPIGFLTRRRWFLFNDSYSVSLKSKLPYVYNDLKKNLFERQDEILQAIAQTAAQMHEKGFLHKDFSGGNILFDDQMKNIPIELVDLNRLVFGKIGEEEGCKNFERLPGTDEMISVMGTTYAKERGFDPQRCIEKMKKYIEEEKKTREKAK